MNSKLILTASLLATLTACGGSDNSGEPETTGGNDGGTTPLVSDCVITDDTITVAEGTTCLISAEQGDVYSLSEGSVRCEDGTVIYNDSLSSSTELNLNGLTFTCGS